MDTGCCADGAERIVRHQVRVVSLRPPFEIIILNTKLIIFHTRFIIFHTESIILIAEFI